jgi:DNA-binding NtrC family response regulator
MAKQAATLLIIDDDDDILISAKLFLKQHFSLVVTCNTPKEINNLLSEHKPDLILLDMNYRKGINDGKEGLYWLRHILEIDANHQVILMTAFGDVELAVNALKTGAKDFILKPWNNEKLLATLEVAIQSSSKRQEAGGGKSTSQLASIAKASNFDEMIGESESLRDVFKIIEKAAPTDANILILGENGTGKQVVAKQIHKHSDRANAIFLHVDLGSLSENLFESELFGYAKGAFTDAKEDKAGRFEDANGGTIFLDEIGNLSLPLQAKLLTVMQNRSVTRLGENKPRKIDVRLITATNANINDLISRNEFRQDLYFRVNTMEINLPPLRARKGDVVILANYYLSVYKQKYKKEKLELSKAVINLFETYSWPGNIRELQHVVERAVIMCDGTEIGSSDIQLSSAKSAEQTTASAPDNIDLETMERNLVKRAIDKHQGNISKAAAELGLTRAALYRRMEKFGL